MTAKSNNQVLEAMIAAADMSAKQYHIARLSAADTVNQGSASTQTDLFGVVQNNPGADEMATVCVEGMTPIVCGSSIAVNALITCSPSGRAITGAPASGASAMIIGKVLEAASADGDIVTAWVHAPWRYTNPGY